MTWEVPLSGHALDCLWVYPYKLRCFLTGQRSFNTGSLPSRVRLAFLCASLLISRFRRDGRDCKARAMLPWRRCILAHTELEAAVHEFLFERELDRLPFRDCYFGCVTLRLRVVSVLA
jgi:hypothetical protein